MLKALVYGAVAAFVGSKLKKMNDEGRLEPYKEQARKGAQQLREKMAEQSRTMNNKSSSRTSSGSAAQVGSHAYSSDVSKPAKPHPYPVDPKAMPRGA